jgi:hypothetical protein
MVVMMVMDVEMNREAGRGLWRGGGWDRRWEMLLVLVLGHNGGNYRFILWQMLCRSLLLLLRRGRGEDNILGDEDRGWDQAVGPGRFRRCRGEESGMRGGRTLDSLIEC